MEKDFRQGMPTMQHSVLTIGTILPTPGIWFARSVKPGRNLVCTASAATLRYNDPGRIVRPTGAMILNGESCIAGPLIGSQCALRRPPN